MSGRAHAILLATLASEKSVDFTIAEFESLSGTEAYGEFRAALRTPLQGRFLLSGYPSELYDRFAQQCGWRRGERLIDNKASGKREKKVEVVWRNN